MYYTVPKKLYTWDRFEVVGMPVQEPPVPHTVGALLVFDDEDKAREWAGEGPVFYIAKAEEAPSE